MNNRNGHTETPPSGSNTIRKGKPRWLKKSMPKGGDYQRVTRLLSEAGLHTVCQEAACPNMFECFSKNTATFMILGSNCTRNCRFCNVTSNAPTPVDPDEPQRVAETVLKLKLTYVVVTSVTRDDLPDGGASHFARAIQAIKKAGPRIRVEVLIPDFQGDLKALETVAKAELDVINHNIETVKNLYARVRPQAQYQRSLDLIQNVTKRFPGLQTKSGIMVGLGETIEELEATFQDLYDHGCNILTVGQYLQPTRTHLSVEKFYSPQEFEQLDRMAREIGFKQVASGPFVRSSYKARELFETPETNIFRDKL
ncbi:MAG: lipoyl synthase [Thermodesulfobacteriota bacterium]|nr:lipoyl synthase [Thermodesulfobacteriota bacterium]